jgi:predicted short-subunit dehydrogenase-like oxidoreductase (DUF2520 family)
VKLVSKRIALVGPGNFGTSLAVALRDEGVPPIVVVGRSLESAKSLADKCGAPFYSETPDDLNRAHRLFLLTVPDREIESLAEDLALADLDYEKSTFVHFSGSKPASALSPLRERGASIGSLHAMQTFPSREPVSIEGVRAAIEAPKRKTRAALAKLAERVGMVPFEVSEKGKTLYHLAGVAASNFMIANFAVADFAFERSGAKGAELFEVVGKTAETTLANATRDGYRNALSGPVARGDLETVRAHVEALEAEGKGRKRSLARAALVSYLAQSLQLERMLRQRDGASADRAEIRKYLKKELRRALD